MNGHLFNNRTKCVINVEKQTRSAKAQKNVGEDYQKKWQVNVATEKWTAGIPELTELTNVQARQVRTAK